jgi:hypothetical protein
MTQYLLGVIEPSEGEPPSAREMAAIETDVAAFDREVRAAGVWVFSGGLLPPSTATVVRPGLVSDGPFAEGKEHLGGFCVVEVGSRDEALEWAAKLMRAARLPIEIRPFR